MYHNRKLLYSDSGKGHSSIKLGWISAAIGLLGAGITIYSRYTTWRLQQEFYFLWYDVPSLPSIIVPLAISILTIILAAIAAITISKHEMHIYDNKIEGYGNTFWGLWAHKFVLEYDDVISVKKRKWGLSIRSKMGRYSIFIHDPATCTDIIQNYLKEPK
ncbi:MAG: hypothetical protein FWC32_09410 [Firmicutes bacterium]|nr:hypothetical protein [Bacillota bacterium]